MPLTVGGGVRSLQDVRDLLNAGADKVSIMTAAVQNPELVSEAALRIGSANLVVAIDARRRARHDGGHEESWEICTTAAGSDRSTRVMGRADGGGGRRRYLLTSMDRDARALLLPRVAAGAWPIASRSRVASGGGGSPRSRSSADDGPSGGHCQLRSPRRSFTSASSPFPR